ncbi:MAG: hypothetical protein B1H03_06040, partial [Planctomycetales bacterium 4484_113]
NRTPIAVVCLAALVLFLSAGSCVKSEGEQATELASEFDSSFPRIDSPAATIRSAAELEWIQLVRKEGMAGRGERYLVRFQWERNKNPGAAVRFIAYSSWDRGVLWKNQPYVGWEHTMVSEFWLVDPPKDGFLRFLASYDIGEYPDFEATPRASDAHFLRWGETMNIVIGRYEVPVSDLLGIPASSVLPEDVSLERN